MRIISPNFFIRLWKVFVISSLTIALKAQEKSDSTEHLKLVHLSDIVVTAERTPVQAYISGRLIRIIPEKEIKNLPACSIADLLEYEPNTDIRQRGAGGVQSDISIQGSTFDQTLILLNGINICDPQTGHHNMNIPVEPENISRIEILKGPASRSFGNNAFGGVINIITENEKTLKTRITASAGNFGFYRAGFNISFPFSSIQNYFAFSQQESEGYTTNTDYRITNLYYNSRVVTSPLRIEFQAGITARDFGANSFYTPRFPDQFEQIRTIITSIHLKTNKGTSDISSNIYWRRNQDHYTLFRYQNPSGHDGNNNHLTDVIGGGFNFSLPFQYGNISMGFDMRYERILSNILGEILHQPVNIPWNDSLQFTRGDSRFHTGTFLEYSYTFNKFYLSTGLMLSFNSGNSKNPSLYPGLDLSYRISKSFLWIGSVNRSLRLPSFTDLFYSSPVQLGNKNLMPEKAVTFESGIKYTRHGLQGYLSVFHRMGREIIDWIKFPEESVWKAMNHTRVNLSGIEASIILSPLFPDGKRTGLNFLRLSYSYMNADKDSGEMQSKYVLDQLNHKLDLGVSLNLFRHFGTTWCFRFLQRSGGYQPFKDGKYMPEVPYPSAFLIDGKVYFNFRSLTFYADATNILNSEYFDHANIPEPKCWIKLGLSIQTILSDLNKKQQ